MVATPRGNRPASPLCVFLPNGFSHRRRPSSRLAADIGLPAAGIRLGVVIGVRLDSLGFSLRRLLLHRCHDGPGIVGGGRPLHGFTFLRVSVLLQLCHGAIPVEPGGAMPRRIVPAGNPQTATVMANTGAGGASFCVSGHHHRPGSAPGASLVPGPDLRLSASGDLFRRAHEQFLRLVCGGAGADGRAAGPGPPAGAGRPRSTTISPGSWRRASRTSPLSGRAGFQPGGHLLDWRTSSRTGRGPAGGDVLVLDVVFHPL